MVTENTSLSILFLLSFSCKCKYFYSLLHLVAAVGFLKLYGFFQVKCTLLIKCTIAYILYFLYILYLYYVVWLILLYLHSGFAQL